MPTEAATLRLLSWFSPAFPTGAFGYSHGLETAIREGAVTDADTLTAWLSGLVELGSGWTDAVLFAAAWRDPESLAETAELACAYCISAERRRETLGQGEAFLAAAGAFEPALPNGPIPYPVAAGHACATASLPLDAALTAYVHAFTANLVSVAIRAVPLGQSDGVAVLAALEPVVLETAGRAVASGLDDLGACAVISDIMALRHETLDGRLFIS